MGTRLLPANEPQSIVRFHASICLLRFGEEGRDVINEVVVGARDPSSYDTRRLCCRILEAIGQLKDGTPDRRAVEALLKGCEDVSASVRLEAVVGLGSLGRSPDAALQKRVDDALKARLHDRDRTIIVWTHVSQMALTKVTEDGIKPIVAFIKNSGTETRVRIQAIRAIGTMSDRAASAIPVLIDQLNDKDPNIVVAACAALGNMGKAGMPALGPLKTLAEPTDANPVIKAAAEAAMMLIKGDKPGALQSP
jgi:HEAT repeat protein